MKIKNRDNGSFVLRAQISYGSPGGSPRGERFAPGVALASRSALPTDAKHLRPHHGCVRWMLYWRLRAYSTISNPALPEMFIKSERSPNPFAPHDGEGIAIDQIPFFVAAGLPELLCFEKYGSLVIPNFHAGRLLEPLIPLTRMKR